VQTVLSLDGPLPLLQFNAEKAEAYADLNKQFEAGNFVQPNCSFLKKNQKH
jgi:hypothetical protein